MATPHLTAMRQALWTALEANAALAAKIKTKFKWEDSGATLSPTEFIPALGECPALSIFPLDVRSTWETNQEQEIFYTLGAKYWTPEWNVLTAERIWELIERAFWQYPALFNSIYSDSTIGLPSRWRRVPSSDGDESATLIEVTWNFDLRWKWNPRLETDPLT